MHLFLFFTGTYSYEILYTLEMVLSFKEIECFKEI